MSQPLFAGLLAAFAREVGAGPHKRVVLLLDNAGWHTLTNLAVPDGLRLVYLLCNDKFGVRLTTIEMAGLSGFVTEAVAAL